MKLSKLIDSGIPIICGVLLLVIVSLTFGQIVLRNFFATGLSWYDDVAQFSMSWMVLFSSVWLTKHHQHLNTGMKLHQKLNKKTVCLIDSLLELGTAIITGVVAYQTAIFALAAMDIDSMALPWLKMGYIFVVLPIAMVGMMYYCLKSFFKNFTLIFKKNKAT
jgi:TRAP-type C4-dicarboxylate transport system permease small subunit